MIKHTLHCLATSADALYAYLYAYIMLYLYCIYLTFNACHKEYINLYIVHSLLYKFKSNSNVAHNFADFIYCIRWNVKHTCIKLNNSFGKSKNLSTENREMLSI